MSSLSIVLCWLTGAISSSNSSSARCTAFCSWSDPKYPILAFSTWTWCHHYSVEASLNGPIFSTHLTVQMRSNGHLASFASCSYGTANRQFTLRSVSAISGAFSSQVIRSEAFARSRATQSSACRSKSHASRKRASRTTKSSLPSGSASQFALGKDVVAPPLFIFGSPSVTTKTVFLFCYIAGLSWT